MVMLFSVRDMKNCKLHFYLILYFWNGKHLTVTTFLSYMYMWKRKTKCIFFYFCSVICQKESNNRARSPFPFVWKRKQKLTWIPIPYFLFGTIKIEMKTTQCAKHHFKTRKVKLTRFMQTIWMGNWHGVG